MSGGGSLVSGGLTLNNASSKLLLNSITLDNASTSADSLGLDVDADSTVTSLSVANITPVAIASGSSLSGAITVTAGSIKLAETGTLASNVSMSAGTFLDADESMTISGSLTQSGSFNTDQGWTIDVAAGKTLTYTGAAIGIEGHKLILTSSSSNGGATFNNTNPLLLNNANSYLRFDAEVTVGSVSVDVAGNSGRGLKIKQSSTISSLTVTANTELSIYSGKSLSGAITLATGSIKLNKTGTLASSVSMSGGTLDADESLTLSGALTQSGDIAIDVASGKTLTYSGAALNLGAYTLTLSGEGRLSNTYVLGLNNANSKLLLSGSITVDRVSTSLASLGLDVDGDSTVTSLSVGHTTPVSIASGKILSGAITVSAGSLKLNEAGTLASTIAMSGGTLDADESLSVSGALSHSANIAIDVWV